VVQRCRCRGGAREEVVVQTSWVQWLCRGCGLCRSAVGADVQMCRCADVLMCRCGAGVDVQVHRCTTGAQEMGAQEMHSRWCTGAQVHR